MAARARRAAVVALLATLAAASCSSGGGSASGPSPAPAPAPTPGPGPQLPESCATLTNAECLSSRTCVLDHVTGLQYRCRPAAGPCELAFKRGGQAACEREDGCVFAPGSCYCPGPAPCVCAGGPVPSCRAAPAPPVSVGDES